MALVYVGGTTGIAAGGTSNWTVSLTSLTGGIASSPSIGDVVVVFGVGGYSNSAVIYQILGVGYTAIDGLFDTGSTSAVRIDATYKRLTSADTTVTISPSQDTRAAAAVAIQVWRSTSTSTLIDVTTVKASGSGTGRPNPGAITPVTTGAVILAAGGAASGAGAVFTSSDLTAFITATSPDTTDAMVGAGYNEWTGGAFDPAQFGGGTTGAGDAWAALTIALRPYVVAAINFPALPKTLTISGFDAGLQVRPFNIGASPLSISVSGYAAGLIKATPPVRLTRTAKATNDYLGSFSVACSLDGRTIASCTETQRLIQQHSRVVF
jgi:hypothetical protein